MRSFKIFSVLMMMTLAFSATVFADVDADKQAAHDKKLFDHAAIYFKQHRTQFENQDFLGVIDYTRASNEPRFFVVDLKNGAVDAYLTTHGHASDIRNTGRATHFSNEPLSHATSIGIFKTGSTFNGKNGLRLPVIGLSKSNSNASARGIVIGGAKYVNEDTGVVGRSEGIMVESSRAQNLIRELKNGAMIYAYGEEAKK